MTPALYPDERASHILQSSEVPFPLMHPVRQHLNRDRLHDVEAAVWQELRRPSIWDRIPTEGTVAIGVGSRGLASLPTLVRTVVTAVREKGAEPFIVPAMGSHGGATPEGQQRVLSDYGITEDQVHAPIRSSMETVKIADLELGVPLFLDRLAFEATGYVVINRVKPHTCFRGPVESGLSKMLAIGLGKREGASSLHHQGFERFGKLIPAAATLLASRTRFLFGLATIENAFEEVAHVEAVPSENLVPRETKLLKQARSSMGRILVPEFDLLIVDEIGKDISGDGMDPNVTGRSPQEGVEGGSRIQKIVVLGLTERTGGNAMGIGMADITTREVLERIDFVEMYTNGATSMVLTSSRLPVVMPTRESAIALGLATLHRTTPEAAAVIRIRNTLSLHEIEVSEALWRRISHDARFEVLGSPRPLAA